MPVTHPGGCDRYTVESTSLNSGKQSRLVREPGSHQVLDGI